MSNKNTGAKSIYEDFPFMQAFPFEDYSIEIESDDAFYGEDLEGLDFSKMPGLRDLDRQNIVNFTYMSKNSDVVISFHKDDVLYIDEVSESIKKLDSIRERIDKGLATNSLKLKIRAIGHGDIFIKRVSPAFEETKETFKTVLDSMLVLHEVEMSQKMVLKIITLDKNIDMTKLTPEEVKTIMMYLDFQLHHARIILGVVIASKIF